MILSWTDELIRIYDCCILNEDKSNRPVPIYHVKENAQITISITKDGEITPIGRFAEIVAVSYTHLTLPTIRLV